MKKLLILLLFLPSIASAWGGVGHEVVCEIASQELSAKARIEIQRLMDLDAKFDTFSESCSWADRLEERSLDHYVNQPRDLAVITTDECPLAKTCVFSAIKKDQEILKDGSQPDQARLEALKLLGHWVGDIHQPLHVSFQDDRGGSSIYAAGMCSGALHGVWDGCIIERQMGKDAKAIASKLYASLAENQARSWQSDSPIEWADESYQVTLSSQTGYCTMNEGACWYWSMNMMLDEGEMQREMIITQGYLSANQKIIELRLQQAGIRLGAMLNAAMK